MDNTGIVISVTVEIRKLLGGFWLDDTTKSMTNLFSVKFQETDKRLQAFLVFESKLFENIRIFLKDSRDPMMIHIYLTQLYIHMNVLPRDQRDLIKTSFYTRYRELEGASFDDGGNTVSVDKALENYLISIPQSSDYPKEFTTFMVKCIEYSIVHNLVKHKWFEDRVIESAKEMIFAYTNYFGYVIKDGLEKHLEREEYQLTSQYLFYAVSYMYNTGIIDTFIERKLFVTGGLLLYLSVMVLLRAYQALRGTGTSEKIREYYTQQKGLVDSIKESFKNRLDVGFGYSKSLTEFLWMKSPSGWVNDLLKTRASENMIAKIKEIHANITNTRSSDSDEEWNVIFYGIFEKLTYYNTIYADLGVDSVAKTAFCLQKSQGVQFESSEYTPIKSADPCSQLGDFIATIRKSQTIIHEKEGQTKGLI